MSKYTTELRYLREQGFNLGLDTYPIFDENYRVALNNKILNHYNFREIGFETAALFRFYLNQTMDEQMPYFNQLYLSEKIKIEAITRRSETETLKRDVTSLQTSKLNGTSNATDTGNTTTDGTNENTANGTANTTDAKRDIYSDTPQAILSVTDLENNLYATNARFNNDTQEQTTTQTDNQTLHNVVDATNTTNATTTTNSENDAKSIEDYTRNIIGNNPSFTDAQMLKQFRETFLNIDMMVIDSLKDLFINLW